jgi:hypothetical protein
MREHLIEPLAASGVLVETVMCLDKDLPTELKRNVHTGLRVVHLSAVGDLQLRQQGRSFAGFQREAECFQRALQRELACVPKLRDQTSAEVTALLQRGQHASKTALRWSEPRCAPGSSVYDFFLFARPDLLWLQPFPVEALLERNAVSLRAQRLCFDPNVFWFSEQAQSAYHLRCTSCRGCFMVPDDQFALVPRRFAAAYFAEHRFFEATVPNRTLAEREQEYTVLLSHMLMTISSNITRGLKKPCEVPKKPNVLIDKPALLQRAYGFFGWNKPSTPNTPSGMRLENLAMPRGCGRSSLHRRASRSARCEQVPAGTERRTGDTRRSNARDRTPHSVTRLSLKVERCP